MIYYIYVYVYTQPTHVVWVHKKHGERRSGKNKLLPALGSRCSAAIVIRDPSLKLTCVSHLCRSFTASKPLLQAWRAGHLAVMLLGLIFWFFSACQRRGRTFGLCHVLGFMPEAYTTAWLTWQRCSGLRCIAGALKGVEPTARGLRLEGVLSVWRAAPDKRRIGFKVKYVCTPVAGVHS